jgi:hypothetical protein
MKHPRRGAQSESEARVKLYLGIGRFTHEFSQLEFTIRAILSGALGLSDDQFDAVTSPYDFAMLCRVTSAIYTIKHGRDPETKKTIEKLFSDCARLNDDRVRMAHGTWSVTAFGASARHVSRQTLAANQFFEDPKELSNLADRAKELMRRLIEELPGPL